MEQKIVSLDVNKAYTLLNLGGTVLVSTQLNGDKDVMAAAWATALDFDKAMVVIDSTHYTRRLIEGSEYFAVQVPVAEQAKTVMQLGTVSKNDDPQKLEHSDVELFTMPGFDVPLVKGCAGWLICQKLDEPHNQSTYDLFCGKVVAAWSDADVFEKGHWKLEQAGASKSTLHYVAGGHFYTIGDSVDITL